MTLITEAEVEAEREEDGDTVGSEVEEEDVTAVGTNGIVVGGNNVDDDEVVAVSVLAECRWLMTPSVSALASGMNATDAGASFWFSTPLCSSWVSLLSGMKSR